ncbi:nucleolar complex protein 2 homolog isoform X2 [Helianthus annuus]|uniref:nucleolar complex protein 2 homolog isoform X2 n=1 Tax=Helianthus annuus TaxID=4232 RepID=UPI000B900AC9|nr:nucleolar complex protein 2 homolog isoform X2 [Helianthus annuus]
MGKLGKKARKFAKKNLPSVLKQRRKNKIVFKKRPSKNKNDGAVKEVVKAAELSNGRNSDKEVTVTTSFDALFSEDDDTMVLYDSDSDGYLSEDPSCGDLVGNDDDVTLEDAEHKRTLSVNNQKVYEELAAQKKLLDKLKKKDKKFVKFLESYNKGEISENQEMYSDEDDDHMELDDTTTTKYKVLTSSVIGKWSKLVTEGHNEPALINLINAYRAACHFGPEETGPTIQDSETFCNVYTFMLSEADNIFRVLLKIPINCKKETLLELKNTSRWKKVQPMIKSYFRSTLFLLKQVTDSEILAFSITRLRASIVFFAAFPSLLNRLIQIIVPLWATGGGTLSVSSSLILQDVVSVCGSNHFDACFIKTYKAYISRCRNIETVDTKHIEFLRDSFINLCSLDLEKSSNKALVSIQQLTNILKHARQQENKEAIKKIYSWQYVQCIDIWVLFISANVNECDVQSLLYAMIQLINGVACLFPGPKYFPLRIRCVQWLNKLSSSCGVFIPVASLILDMVEYKVNKEGGKSRKRVKLASDLKLPKFWLKSQNFVEQCVNSAIELLVVHFFQWSYHISFPELAVIPLIRLKKFYERSTAESLKRVVKRLMDMVEQNVEFAQKKRDDVAFSPKDHESVDQFLQFEKGTLNTPFTQYYKSVIEKSASKTSTSPKEPEKVKRKKTQNAGGDVDANIKGKKRRVVET